MSQFNVLVLCTGNSARSQIAEALFRKHGGTRIQAASAGTQPASQVNPYAIAILEEHGIDWRGREPRSVDGMVDKHWDLVITVCDDAKESCPIFPDAAVTVHWGMRDPADQTDAAAARHAFRKTFALLQRRIDKLLQLPLETMSTQEIRDSAQQIAEEIPQRA